MRFGPKVQKQIHHSNDPQSQMKVDLSRTFCDFLMQRCGLQVESLSSFLAFGMVETFAEFGHESSVVGHAAPVGRGIS
jgi:hypothetical protein